MYSRKNRAQCGITYLTRLTKDGSTCLTPLDVLASRLHTTSQKQSTLTLDAVGRGRDCVHRPRHDVVTPSFFDRVACRAEQKWAPSKCRDCIFALAAMSQGSPAEKLKAKKKYDGLIRGLVACISRVSPTSSLTSPSQFRIHIIILDHDIILCFY